MLTIHMNQTTSLTPEQYIAALTDFGPGRSEIFNNSAPQYLQVHSSEGSRADVTEGSGGIWERLHYDWSHTDRVVLKTVGSNAWGGASGHTYRFKRLPSGRTSINVVVIREGKNLRGWLIELVLRTVGRDVLAKSFEASIVALERRAGLGRAGSLPPASEPTGCKWCW